MPSVHQRASSRITRALHVIISMPTRSASLVSSPRSADGSFLEHLLFCRDYAARHYPAAQGSPRVMLLHSIMGVGTNCFPMSLDRLPTLASLLSPTELTQIQAFPSVLRLLVHGPLLKELCGCSEAKLQTLRRLRFHRLLDNEPLELSAPQFWEHLNYQLIHSIDFLPPAAWKRTSNEYFFAIFTQLYDVLSRTGNLAAAVEWDEAWMQPNTEGARPDTWRHWFIDLVPSKAILAMASKTIANYSADVGHSLEYSLEFEGGAKL